MAVWGDLRVFLQTHGVGTSLAEESEAARGAVVGVVAVHSGDGRGGPTRCSVEVCVA